MVKLLSIWIALLVISGCGALPQSSNQSSNGCPNQPQGSLDAKNVKLISLDSSTLKESGQAIAGKSIAYTFEAKSGQKFSYRTSDSICVWIYTPDNQLLSGGDLPLTGKYILQVSAPKGSTTFDLEMSLGTLQASAPATSSPISSPTATPTFTPSSSSASTTTVAADLTQDKALEIVQNWYRSKPRIFAPPFDTSLVDQYATGPLHNKTTRPDPSTGRIAWLRANNSYYIYRKSEITKVIDFSNSGSQPSIKIRVYEDLALYGPKGIDRTNSGPYQADFIYYFQKDNGIWKISDYDKVS